MKVNEHVDACNKIDSVQLTFYNHCQRINNIEMKLDLNIISDIFTF